MHKDPIPETVILISIWAVSPCSWDYNKPDSKSSTQRLNDNIRVSTPNASGRSRTNKQTNKQTKATNKRAVRNAHLESEIDPDFTR